MPRRIVSWVLALSFLAVLVSPSKAQHTDTGYTLREKTGTSVPSIPRGNAVGKTAQLVAVSVLGPLFPPPLGVNFSEIGGDIGRTGGRTWLFQDVTLADLTVVYWGAVADSVLLSLDDGLYTGSEVMTYQSSLSDPVNGIAVWMGETRLPNDATPVYTKFTLTVTVEGSGLAIALTDAQNLGLPASVGAVVPVTSGLAYQVIRKYEASYDPTSGFIPHLDFYDAETPSGTAGTAYSSFSAGFYWENVQPTVVNMIPDTTVNEDDPVIDNYRDLNTVFADLEDGTALTFTVQDNTPPDLVTVTIDADSALDLSFVPDANGTATITIRAEDSGGSAVNDTFVVTVTGINDPPRLTANNLLTVNQGASGVITSALLKATDVESPSAQITFTVAPSEELLPPHNGTLKLNDVQLVKGSTFTQEDIDSGRVSYEHDGSATTADDFTFEVADAEGVKVSDQGFTVFTFRITIVTVVGVIDRVGMPTEYALETNYPNPFNPSTTIRYQLPAAGHVSIKVFDLTGKQVRTLVNEAMPAGYYRAVWKGRDAKGAAVATGVYFYQITVDNAFVQTRKMVLMK